MASSVPPTSPELNKTKEEALQACVDQHAALVACFKTCSFTSSFTGCCTEEHKVFWECYTRERGTNQTRITTWLDGIFGGPPPPAEPQPAASRGSGSSAASEQQ